MVRLSTKYYFWRWLTCFCEIIDGLCGVVTGGFWSPKLNLKAWNWWLCRPIKEDE